MSQQIPPTINAQFNDPQADISLLSNDNVLFRVYLKDLTKSSQVFLNMLASEPHALPPTYNNADPILFDEPAAQILLYLRYVSIPMNASSLSLDECGIMIHIADKWDCPDIQNEIITHLHELCHTIPGDIFQLSCRIENFDLAKFSMSFYYSAKQGERFLPWMMPVSEYKAMPGPFGQGLTRALVLYYRWHFANVSQMDPDFMASWRWNVLSSFFHVGGTVE